MLDLNLSITNGIVSSKIYDKRDDFNFEIVKFPFLMEMFLARSPSIGVQWRYRFLIQPLNSTLTHHSLALRYHGGTGTITQWIDNWNDWNDIGHTIPLLASNRRAPEKV